MKRFRKMLFFVILIFSSCIENEAIILIEPNQDQCLEIGGPSSPLVYVEKFHKISPEFWSEGVDTSKGILETVLKKINSAGSHLDYLLKEHSSLLIINRFQAIEQGEIWIDKEETPRMSLSVNEGSFCAIIDNLKYPLPELSYTCTESEQLYAVGYHKVYESCKTEPFFEKIDVDWPTCFHAHYPWVDMLETSICVVKSYINDFLACFCSLEDGKITKRGFCLTKLECALTIKGKPEKGPKRVVFGDECFYQVHYFLEAKTMDKVDFENAHLQENLRVRPPYHPESVCNKEQFSSLFDIGQLDVDNMESGMMVYTPGFRKSDDQTVEQISVNSLEHLVNIRALKVICVKRIMLNIISLVLGTVLIILTKLGTSSFVTTILQMLILSSGTLNFLIAIIPDHLEVQFLILAPIFVQLILNNKENTTFFLQLSIINMCLETMIWILLNKGFGNILGIYNAYFIIIGLYTIYTLIRKYEDKKYLPKPEEKVKTKTEPNTKKNAQSSLKKKESKKEHGNLTMKKGKEEKQKQKQNCFDKNVAKINCHMDCNNIPNSGYVSINCSTNCFIEFHNECWKAYLSKHGILDQDCPGKQCVGKILEIVTVDKFGKEIRKQEQILRKIIKKKTKSEVLKSEMIKSAKENVFKKKTKNKNKKQEKATTNSPAEKETNVKLKGKETVKETPIHSSKNISKNKDKVEAHPDQKRTSSLDYTTFCHEEQKKHTSGFIIDHVKKDNAKKTETESLLYIPGKPATEESDPTYEVTDKEEEAGEKVQDVAAWSPLTRILHREVTGYTMEELDKAVLEILSETDSASLTIPEFKDILMKKLEADLWPDGIYISDDDDE